MINYNNLPNDLLKLLNKIMQNKTYGSLEIFFENGKITQITQRIISKIQHKTNVKVTINNKNSVEQTTSQSIPTDELPEKFGNI